MIANKLQSWPVGSGTQPFLNLFVSNLKIGDNISPRKHFTKFFPSLPLNNVEVQKLYKISEMCWSLDSQHCLGGRGVVIIDVLLKIWLSVPNVLVTIVRANRITSTLKPRIDSVSFLFKIVVWVN